MPDEYISRERLLEDINAAVEHGGMGEIIGQTLRRYILRQPAADVAPVVHGQWTPLPSMAPEYACSVCGRDYTWGELEEAPYCPNCGARMDGWMEDAEK